jgi:hypothetical protein
MVKKIVDTKLKCPPIIQNEVIRINLRGFVTIVLRKIFPIDDYKKLVGDITKAIDLRNEIIHASEIDVPKDKAKKVIEDVDKYIKFLGKEFSNLNISSD